MAEILIKGLEMPKDDILRIEICPNGQVNRIIGWALSEMKRGKAIEVPPHGRLVDLDLVEEWMRKKHKDNDCPFDIDAFLLALRKIPTVLEASK